MTGNGVAYDMNSAEDHSGIRRLGTVFDKISNAIETMQPFIASAAEGVARFPSLEDDIKSIQSACELFIQLLDKDYASLKAKILDETVTEDHVKEVRHDLRAKVGAIMGYSELILEELSDFESDDAANYGKSLKTILEKAKSLVPVVDSLRLDELTSQVVYGNNENAPDTYALMESNLSYGDQFAECTVLIIDDSAYNREILHRRLSRYGVKVATADNGAAGLELVAQRPVDLIMLDIMMPIMNGYEVLTRLKADSRLKDIPVLMISALSEVDSIVRCIEAGAEDYLPTPFNPIVLHARIKACLEKKMLRDREQENLYKLEMARKKLETAIESIDDGFAVFDNEHRLTLCNDQFQLLYPGVKALGGHGFTYEELLRKNLEKNVYFQERRRGDQHHAPMDDPEDWIAMNVSRQRSLDSYLMRLNDGRWIEVVNSATPDGGQVSVHKDVTNRKQDEERLTFLALHDALTGLANRSAFDAKLTQAFRSENPADSLRAVMYLDLDGFKRINDTLGHDVGDQVLVFMAEALKKCMRSHDLIARLGGDEFGILLPRPCSKEDLSHIADRILKAVGDHYTHNGEDIPFGVSIGIALYPEDATQPDELLNNSDTAMYAAKKAGKGHYRFFQDLNS